MTQRFFIRLRHIFNVESNKALADVLAMDAAHISRMFSGLARITPTLLFRVCILKEWTPQKLASETGINLMEYLNE